MFRRGSNKTNAKDPQQIFSKFLEFLETDMWVLPITNFMEQNSIAFEREQGEPETFAMIYKEFTGLVDTLIDSYCQDVGIIGQDLVDALKGREKSSKLSYKEKVLLEPVVAAQDFNVFVPMMMRKNIELQLQALKMLEHLSGLLPSSLKLDEEDAEIWKVLFDEDESERLILISVLKQSREEWEHDQRMREEWQKQLDAATQNSLKEKELLESMRRLEQQRLEEAMTKAEGKFHNMSIGTGTDNRDYSNLLVNCSTMTMSASTSAAKCQTTSTAQGTSIGDMQKELQTKQSSSQQTSTDLNMRDKGKGRNISTSTINNPDQAQSSKETNTKNNKSGASSTNTNPSGGGQRPESKARAVKDQPTDKLTDKVEAKQDLKKPPSNQGGKRASLSSVTKNPEAKSPDDKSASGIEESQHKSGNGNRRASLGKVRFHENMPLPAGEDPNGHDGYGYRLLLKDRQQIPDELIRQRATYLREQRDKLLQMKKKEREKQLIESSKQSAIDRPRTAKAARGALSIADEAQELENRRHIAEKIKAEVMHMQDGRKL